MVMNAVFAADAEIGSDAVFAADSGFGSDAVFRCRFWILAATQFFAADAEIAATQISLPMQKSTGSRRSFRCRCRNRQRRSFGLPNSQSTVMHSWEGGVKNWF
ncbi:hypothetical protein D5086_001776 [Populus alba]|uniref:Uncharacterized protein n=1 Tax=Populus alba TaxID=43335 RepID=A0ACC4CZM4_POPAL